MLENQLLLTVVFKQHRILVKGAYFACEFNPADQVYRNRGLIFADRIKKRVLNVLCRLIVHVPISNFYDGRIALWKMLKLLQLLQSLGSEPECAQVLLQKVYTASRLAPGPVRRWAQKPATTPNGGCRRWFGCVISVRRLPNMAVLTLRMWETGKKVQLVPR